MRPPTLLLHGFMGRGADWDAVRASLPADWDICAPDLPGHGDAVGAAATMGAAADLVLADAKAPVDVVGYSMGGRLALHIAVTRPDAVRRVVVVSGSPGLRTSKQRAERRAVDAARADALTADLPGFVADWYRMPLWDPLPDIVRAELVADRIRHNDAVGLAASLRGMGTGAQPSDWGALAGISAPVWAVAGARDAKFVALAHDMARTDGIDAVVIPDAGHMLTVEAPGALSSLLIDLLQD